MTGILQRRRTPSRRRKEGEAAVDPAVAHDATRAAIDIKASATEGRNKLAIMLEPAVPHATLQAFKHVANDGHGGTQPYRQRKGRSTTSPERTSRAQSWLRERASRKL
jgi:hypothetical protein